jgi:hypothetical protein
MSYEWAVYSTRAEDEPLLAAVAAAEAPPPAPIAPPPPLDPRLVARGLAFEGVCAPGHPPTRADYSAAQALLLCHYSLHGGFVNGDGQQLLQRVAAAARSGALARVACSAVHGGADAVCPPRNAEALRAAWPASRVDIVRDGGVGHSMYSPALVDGVLRATDAAADAADSLAATAGGAAPLRARRLGALAEGERARREAEVAAAAAALTRA